MSAQFAGLVLAAIVAFSLSPVPPRTPFTTARLILALAWYIPLPVFIAAFTPVLLLRRTNAVRWPIALTAVWFAPCGVLGIGWAIPFLLWIAHLTAVTTAAPPVVHRLLSAAAALVFQFAVVLAVVEKLLLSTLLSVFPIHLLCRGLSPFSTQRATVLSLPFALLLTYVGLSRHAIIPPPAPTPVPPMADELPSEPDPPERVNNLETQVRLV